MRFGKRVNFQWPVLLLMFIVGLGVYWNALWNPFQYDDGSVIVNNPYIRNIRNIPFFFSNLKLSQLIDDAGATIHYRPLWSASYAINYAISGLNPSGYHLVNLGFHVGSAFLVFLILEATLGSSKQVAPTFMIGSLLTTKGNATRHIVGDKPPRYLPAIFKPDGIALASGLIFLVHPFNSEVVNYITARSSVMCAFFFLLAFYFWVKYRKQNQEILHSRRDVECNDSSRCVPYYIASLLAFLLAMLTKEIAITLPIILFMYDLYSSKNSPSKWKSYIPYLPFILLLSIPLIMIYLGEVQLKSGRGFKFERGFIPHLYSQAGVIIEYFKLFFLPRNLSIDHYFKVQQTFLTPEVFVPVIFLLLYIVIALSIPMFLKKFLKKEWMWVSFFMIFFLITLLPTTVVPLNALMQENRGYLPFAGITAAGGILLERVYCALFPEDRKEGRKRWRLLITLPLILLFIVYSAGTINRNKVWQDCFTLWADAVQRSPDSPRAHANLAYAYIQRGDNDMAMKEFVEALRLNPDDTGLHNDVATFYYGQNDFERAEYHLKAAISIRPDYYLAYSNLGLLYERLGRPEEAIPLYQRALKLKPDFATARARLKRALVNGNKQERD